MGCLLIEEHPLVIHTSHVPLVCVPCEPCGSAKVVELNHFPLPPHHSENYFGMPTRCVSHKEKTFVVYHKVKVCLACGFREFSKSLTEMFVGWFWRQL